jgi:hypothetical protein
VNGKVDIGADEADSDADTPPNAPERFWLGTAMNMVAENILANGG